MTIRINRDGDNLEKAFFSSMEKLSNNKSSVNKWRDDKIEDEDISKKSFSLRKSEVKNVLTFFDNDDDNQMEKILKEAIKEEQIDNSSIVEEIIQEIESKDYSPTTPLNLLEPLTSKTPITTNFKARNNTTNKKQIPPILSEIPYNLFNSFESAMGEEFTPSNLSSGKKGSHIQSGCHHKDFICVVP